MKPLFAFRRIFASAATAAVALLLAASPVRAQTVNLGDFEYPSLQKQAVPGDRELAAAVRSLENTIADIRDEIGAAEWLTETAMDHPRLSEDWNRALSLGLRTEFEDAFAGAGRLGTEPVPARTVKAGFQFVGAGEPGPAGKVDARFFPVLGMTEVSFGY